LEGINHVVPRFLARPALAHGARNLDDAGNNPAIFVGFFVGDRQPKLQASVHPSTIGALAMPFEEEGVTASWLQVVEPQIGRMLLVLNPATTSYSYVNATGVGPSGAPPG